MFPLSYKIFLKRKGRIEDEKQKTMFFLIQNNNNLFVIALSLSIVTDCLLCVTTDRGQIKLGHVRELPVTGGGQLPH